MSSRYAAPGRVADLDGRPDLEAAWQQVIAQAWTDGAGDFREPEHSLDHVSPAPLDGDEVTILWSPVPRQALACLGRSTARRLCDATAVPGAPAASLRSGREWHQEYCEYRIIMASDGRGLRPKRVEITTELREYWEMLAVHSPPVLLAVARDVLQDDAVTYEDLYGLPAPNRLPPEDRRDRFVRQTAGSALAVDRIVPEGPLNREHALFMCHPINGLDDLTYITTLGAQPYYRMVQGRRSAAPLPWVFLDNALLRHLPEAVASLHDTYCRHSDPAAVAAAYQVVFGGGRLAFADPPGVYLRDEDFDLAALSYEGRPLDPAWVRWSRPRAGTRHQRLVLGPPDDLEDVFLDDIQVCRGAEPTPLLGGYQLLELLSVGPNLTVQQPPPDPPVVPPTDLELQPLQESVPCGASGSSVCRRLRDWADWLNETSTSTATGTNAVTCRYRRSEAPAAASSVERR
jgi:hypothetical protein